MLRVRTVESEARIWCDGERNAGQCRQRYHNFLSQNRDRSAWTAKEDELVVTNYLEFGPRWVHISTFLPGRSGNVVKNRWYTRLVKRFMGSDGGAESTEMKRNHAPPAPSPMAPMRPALSAFLQSVLN
jgi:hypothetical protein